MADQSNMKKKCEQSCDSAYQKCISSKEHESVCRMKRATCSCSYTIY